MRRDKRSSKKRPKAEDVIAGRVGLGARELAMLIREVNPSGLELSAQETARRYDLKSRLQSLLILRFADEIALHPEPDQPGVVLLVHRPSGLEACHAVMDALDEHARSWVRRELDLASSQPADDSKAASTPSTRTKDEKPKGAAMEGADQLSVDDLLAAGQHAMEAYDYELGQRYFSAAFHRTGGTVKAAVPLLVLLVDHLAADREALELEAEMDAVALESERVRLLLAVAAARSGDRSKALRLVKPVADPRAADVFVSLARAAIDADALGDASSDLVEAKKLDSARGDLFVLQKEIENRRRAEREPLEDNLEQLLAEGHHEQAMAAASAILSRWPESEVARRVLRALEELRQSKLVAELMASGEEALSRGEWTLARSLLQQALVNTTGEQALRLTERVGQVLALERAKAEQAAADDVLLQLGAADPMAGLLGYVALDDTPRCAVRQACALPHLARLDELGIRGGGAAARAGVQAIMALFRAEQVVARDPDAALRLLGSHGKILTGYRGAVDVEDQARRILADRQREAVRQRVQRAQAAVDAGDDARAHQLLQDLSLDALPEQEREAAEKLRKTVADRESFRTWSERLEAMLAAGDLLKARDAIDELYPNVGPRIREHLLDPTGLKIRNKIRELFCVCELDDDPVMPVGSAIETTTKTDILAVAEIWGIQACLLKETTVVVVEARSCWVFLRLIDVATLTTTKRIIVRTPEPLQLAREENSDGKLFLVGQQGFVLVISIEDWSVRLWMKVWSAPKQDGTTLCIIEEAALAPGARFLWLVSLVGDKRVVRIVDLERRRVVRELADPGRALWLRPTHGRKEPRMVAIKPRSGRVTYYEIQGNLAPERDFVLPILADSITVHPDRMRLVALVTGKSGGWIDFLPGASLPAVQPLGWIDTEIDPDGKCAALTDFVGGMVFILFTTVAKQRYLLAFRTVPRPSSDEGSTASSLEPVYCIPVSDGISLLQQVDQGKVIAAVPTGEGVDLVELGASPPSFSVVTSTTASFEIPWVSGGFSDCHLPTGERLRTVSALTTTLRGEPYRARQRRVASMIRAQRPDLLVHLVYAFEMGGLLSEAQAASVLGAKHFADHAEVRLTEAHWLCQMGLQWQMARTVLTSLDTGALDERTLKHYYHLLGSACLMLDDCEEALRVLRQGALLEQGSCDLGPLIALAAPLGDEPEPEDAWSADERPVRKLCAAVRSADACIARGQAASIRRSVPEKFVIDTEEIQSMARLVVGYLAVEPKDSIERFIKAFVLAAYCELNMDKLIRLRRELPFPGARWDAAHLDAVAEQAMAWLNENFGGPTNVKVDLG